MEGESLIFELTAAFLMLIFTIAVLGSVLTISAVIYAKINGKYNFDTTEVWRQSTIFVINVACVDIVYCLLYLGHGIYALQFYLGNSGEDTTIVKHYATCKFFVLGTQNLACISGWSIALTAFSGAFPKIRLVSQPKISSVEISLFVCSLQKYTNHSHTKLL